MTRALVAISMLAVLLAAVPSAFADDCLDRLATRAYTCDYKSSSAPDVTGSSTLAFNVSSNAAWSVYDNFGAFCTCATDGSFKNPKFHHSPSKWQCVGTGPGPVDGEVVTLSIEGSVGGSGALSKVRAQALHNDVGVFFTVTYVLNCTQD